MGQKGFFDIAQRYAGLDAKNDPLARIDEVVPWEDLAASRGGMAQADPRNGSRRQFVSPGTRW